MTFRETAPGDLVFTGIEPHKEHLVTTAEPTPSGGRLIRYRTVLPNGSTREECAEIRPESLDGTAAERNGNPDEKLFSCREAAVRDEIAKLGHVVRCIEGEIASLQRSREKYLRRIEDLKQETR